MGRMGNPFFRLTLSSALLLATLLLSGAPETAQAEPPRPIGQLGFINKTILGVKMEGHYAYVMENGRLTFLDVANPAAPVVTSQIPLPPNCTSMSGDRGILVLGDNQVLRILDVHDPAAPRLVAVYTVPLPAGVASFYNMSASGDRICIIYREGVRQLRVIDLSDPTSPTLRGGFSETGHYFSDGMTVSEHKLIVNDGQTFGIYDLSNPDAPVYAGPIYPDMDYYYGYAVAGPYLFPLLQHTYINDYHHELYAYAQMFNLDHPNSDVRYFAIYEAYAADVAASTSTLCIAARKDGRLMLNFTDISNLNQIVDLGAVPAISQTVRTAGSVAVNYSGGVMNIIDLARAGGPVISNTYRAMANVTGVEVANNLAYLNQEGTLRIVDVNNAVAPTLLGSLDLGMRDFTLDTGRVYAACGAAGLKVVGAGTPTTPTLTGAFATSGTAASVAVANNIAYVGDADTGLYLLDVTDPAHMQFKGLFPIKGIKDVAVIGNTAFLACGAGGGRVVDATDPANPKALGGYNESVASDVTDVAVSPENGVVFFIDQNAPAPGGGTAAALYSLSASTVRMLDKLILPFTPERLSVAGNTVYVAARGQGYAAFDATYPDSLWLREQVKAPGRTCKVLASGGLIYTAGSEAGLCLLRQEAPPLNLTGLSRPCALNYLWPGKRVYTDRTYCFADDIPSRLKDQLYIQPGNNDKTSTGTAFLQFSIDQPVTLYIALSPQAAKPPQWMYDWYKIPETLATTDPGTPGRVVYKRNYRKGLITLGGARDSNTDPLLPMYSVIVAPRRLGAEDWKGYE